MPKPLAAGHEITRRDFLNGVAIAVGTGLVPGASPGATPLVQAASAGPGPVPGNADYPPSRTGLRGAHPGAFEVAHSVFREGRSYSAVEDAGDGVYDLVVVGGGLSGLAAAHFYRAQAGEHARVLILDNHDDFGGHAKRNEFQSDAGTLLAYGGSQNLESYGNYSPVAKGLVEELGIDASRLAAAVDENPFRPSNVSFYFDEQTYGRNALIVGPWLLWMANVGEDNPVAGLIAKAPLSDATRRDLTALFTQRRDHLPHVSSLEAPEYLRRISYRNFLTRHAGVSTEAADVLHGWTHPYYGLGTDAVSALDGFLMGLPGFQGLGVIGQLSRLLGPVIDPSVIAPDMVWLPDGNATMARLLVRGMIPGIAPGESLDDVVTARFDYSRLDEPDSPVRIRLESTVIGVAHRGAPEVAREVDVSYVRGGQARRVRARRCILACWNHVIPHLVPELPSHQREALGFASKVPLVQTNALLRSGAPLEGAGAYFYSPGSYHATANLAPRVHLGSYAPGGLEGPTVLNLMRAPCAPNRGLSAREQHRLGRFELLGTPFETFEQEVVRHLDGMLGDRGFEADRDLLALTVNRWPHGYAYEYNPLFDPDWPEEERPHIVGRQPFGRIAIANSDSGARAYADCAFDMAHRAVSEILALEG